MFQSCLQILRQAPDLLLSCIADQELRFERSGTQSADIRIAMTSDRVI